MSVKAGGGGLKALAEMAANNGRFFGTAPLRVHKNAYIA